MSGQTNETQEDDALARWHTETLGPVIGRVGERREQFTTDVEGFDVKPLYTAADTVGEAVSNLPGEPPFTRGIYPSMYRSRLWTMRQYAGMGTAAETNERFRYLIDSGSTGLSLAFDLPTQRGMTQTRRSLPVRSDAPGSPSTRSMTWRASSTASTWVRSRRR